MALAIGFGHRDLTFMIAGAVLNVAFFLIATHFLDRNGRLLRSLKATRKAQAARRKAEEESAAKSRLLATVAHDIRTPLTGLIGMADLLDHSRLAPDQRNYVAGIRQAGEVLSCLVEDLLDFATLEAGRFELRRVAQAPRAMIDGIVEILAPRAHFKGLEIASFVSPDVPDFLDLDTARLRQVLFNVIGNAVKFTREGGVSVIAEMDGGMLVIAVVDTGPGMSEGDQQRIFQEFVQVGTSDARAAGKGLGLSISARIVEAFGGKLSVTSELGKGSTFTIRIPVSAAAIAADRHRRSGAVAGSVVLLLAPLGPAAQGILRTITELGGICEVCPDVALAADRLKAGRVAGKPITDVIIDHRMEAGYLRQLKPLAEKLGLRTVFLVNPEERQERITGSYDAWLIRPLREQSLVDVMRGKLRGLERRGATNDNVPHPQGKPGRLEPPSPYILLGDDDPVNILLARTALEKGGHRVVCVTDFTDLGAVLGGAPDTLPELVITDLNMPGGNLASLLDLRARCPSMSRIPVMVLTGERDPEIVGSLLKSGANRVLSKPLLPAELVRNAEELILPSAGESITHS